MPGKRVSVIVTGNGLPPNGRRWGAYRTANRELKLGRSQAQRHTDRQELKSGKAISINGYRIRPCN